MTLSDFTTGSGQDEVTGLAFDTNGTLYVADALRNEVKRYQGPSGASPGTVIDTFVTAGLGGLSAPQDCHFGFDGNLYVVSLATDTVKRYNGSTGAYLGDFITLPAGRLPIPLSQGLAPEGSVVMIE